MDGSRVEDTVTDGYISGRLKWFSEKKGYGFVTCSLTGADALMHQCALHEYGQSSIATDCTIEALTCFSKKGIQIKEILNIKSDVPSSSGPRMSREFRAQDCAPAAPARVKWFSKEKNYGFVNVFGDPRDCFLHADSLFRAGLGSVSVGEALCVSVNDDPGGRVVLSVQAWT